VKSSTPTSGLIPSDKRQSERRRKKRVSVDLVVGGEEGVIILTFDSVPR
jgi:hypothetical protein